MGPHKDYGCNPDSIVDEDVVNLYLPLKGLRENKMSNLKALTGNSPFPWQEELLEQFKKGIIERSLDIPTGLGKTAVMAIWLAARARAGIASPVGVRS